MCLCVCIIFVQFLILEEYYDPMFYDLAIPSWSHVINWVSSYNPGCNLTWYNLATPIQISSKTLILMILRMIPFQ